MEGFVDMGVVGVPGGETQEEVDIKVSLASCV